MIFLLLMFIGFLLGEISGNAFWMIFFIYLVFGCDD